MFELSSDDELPEIASFLSPEGEILESMEKKN